MSQRNWIDNEIEDLPWSDGMSDSTIISDLSKRTRINTPDFIDRKLEHDIPVFVYGTLKTGGFFHDLLEGASFLGDGYTLQNKFYMSETESFPVVFELGSINQKNAKLQGKIFGEVYVIDPKRLLELDRLEANGFMYRRKTTYIKLIDQKASNGQMPTIPAWMYIGVSDYWAVANLTSLKSKDSSAGVMYEWGSRKSGSQNVQKSLLL